MKSTLKRITNRWIGRSTTRDVSIGLILVVGFILISIGVLNYRVSTLRDEQSLRDQARETAQKIADIVSIPLWNLDHPTVKKTAEAYLDAEEVVGLRIRDESDGILFEKTTNESNVINATRLIFYQGRMIGSVEILLSTQGIRTEQQRILINTLINVSLMSVVILLATGLLLEYFLNQPLKTLIVGIDRVADGHYSQALEPAPQSDINDIVQRVNAMAAQIAQRIEVARRERDVIARIMQTSPVGIVMISREGQITFANAQARKVLGMDQDEITQRAYNAREWRVEGREGQELFLLNEELPFWNVMSSAQSVMNVQHAMRNPNGERVLLSINAAPLLDESGKVDGMVATLDNITERKQAEENLRKRLRELEAVQRVSTVLRTARSIDEMLPRLLDETLAVIGTDTGSILLYDAAHDILQNAVARGWFQRLNNIPTRPGDGIAGQVFATGQAYQAVEFFADEHIPEHKRGYVPKGWGGACVPIRSVDQTLGVMFVAVALPKEVHEEDLRLLTTLAEIAGNAFHRSGLHAQTEQRLRRLTALHTLDMAINTNVDLNLTMNILIDQTIAHLGVDAATVLLLNPHTLNLEYATGRGFLAEGLNPRSLRLGQGLAGRAALERQIVKIEDWHQESEMVSQAGLKTLFELEEIVSYYGIPLIVKDQIKGVLEVFHRAPISAEPEWLDFLSTLAGQAAIAINDAQLFSSLQRSNEELALAYDTTLEGWSRALDLRDRETEGHTQRVTVTTVRLAQQMGFSPEEIVHIRRGALLHDIGKMGIPDSILHKPGALTEAEWAIMRKHTQYAYEMLSPIQYLHASLDIPYCHHEKWDGSGYPQGLKGAGIPLAARLFAVVDVWDALTSDRPYRKAWSNAKTLAYLREHTGQHFDPQAVKVFMEMIGEDGE